MSFPQTPDFAGFANAQATLRQQFGKDICFYGTADVIYDPTIPPSMFDDEGMPLDPLASGVVVNEAGVEIANLTVIGYARGNVVFRPLQTSILRRDETFETALGFHSALNRDLILDPADAEPVKAATHYQLGVLARDAAGVVIVPEQFTPEETELWKIVSGKLDHFGPVKRYIFYGQATR